MTEPNQRIEAYDASAALAADGRNKTIVRTSLIGILANVFLAVFKAVVGLTSNSIAVVLDAVNNLSDAASSIITIVGTKLAGRQPDRKHPFGHGRIEYLTAMIISMIVLYAGVTSLTESVKKVIKPETPDYSTAALIIIAASVAVKIALGRYVKSVGVKVNSDSLVNSGEDATLDSIISVSTLVAAVLYLTLRISVEAWLGAVISIVIIKSGVEMLRDTLSRILGERADAELARGIKATVCSFPDVYGAYDLVLNDYGPDTFNGSVHIEVPDTYSAGGLDELIRAITVEVYRKHNVILTAVGVYSINTHDAEAARIREDVMKKALSHEYVMQVHGFYVDREKKNMRFDVIVSFDAPDRRAVWGAVTEELQRDYPDYALQVTLDTDFSES